MPRKRITYDNEGLFIGPAPSTGYNFLRYDGTLNDDYKDLSGNFNLVHPLIRVQEVAFDAGVNRTRIEHLGVRGAVDSPLISPPTVELQFSYLQMGIINELRMGFWANYTQLDHGLQNTPFYSDNFSVCCLSGFISRNLTRASNPLSYPFEYRDKRNLFLTVADEGEEANDKTYTSANANNFVVGFGNCYIQSYSAQAAVGQIPQVNVSYVCENMLVTSSGSGIYSPAVYSKSGLLVKDKHVNIPSTHVGGNVTSAVVPGDITLSINSTPNNPTVFVMNPTGNTSASAFSSINDAIVNFSDLKIQSYSINLDLRREELVSLDHRLPLDRVLNFPLYATLSLSALAGDLQTGNFISLLNNNDDYNVVIRLKNQLNRRESGGIAVQYDFKKAKFEGLSYRNAIGDIAATIDMNFTQEINPDDLTKGFFMSGLLNVDTQYGISGFLLAEDGSYILQEDNSRILLNSYKLYY